MTWRTLTILCTVIGAITGFGLSQLLRWVSQ